MSVETAYQTLRTGKARDTMSDAVRRMRGWPFSLKVGASIVTVVALLGLLAPVLTPYDPIVGNLSEALQPPSLTHPFGTDNFGRDLLARVLYGAAIDLQIGFIATY